MLRKIAGFSGIGSQAVIIGMMLVVVNNSPWFSWEDNYISDFGFTGKLTGLYNWALVVSGMLSAVFVYGLRKSLPLNQTGKRGMVSLFSGSLAFALSGILNKSMDIPHDLSSWASLILVVLGVLLVGAALLHSPHVKLGLFSVAMGTLPMVFWLIPWKWPGDAIPQVFYFGCWTAWTLVFSALLLRMPEPVREEEKELELRYTGQGQAH